MTYLEKYMKKHPEQNSKFYVIASECPKDKGDCDKKCTDCWNREIPKTNIK